MGRSRGWLKHPLGETAVFVVARLLRPDRMEAGDHDDLVGGRKLHDLARRQQRTGGFGTRDHQMTEPWRESVAGIILHGLHLGRHAERIAHPLRGPLVIGRERHAHMAVVEDGVVGAISLLDLVQ